MPDLHRFLATPYLYLLFGVFFIFMAAGYTSQGKYWARFQGWVYRTEEPTRFCLHIAMWYLFGVGFIGYYFFKVFKGSH